MPIEYSSTRSITTDQFIEVLRRSGLAARRPIDDVACMERMAANASLICSAWDEGVLVGVARSLTDHAYCCYLSDLAVDREYQRRGVGKALIKLTQNCLQPTATLILLAAPGAESYYAHLGFDHHPSAWTIGSRGS